MFDPSKFLDPSSLGEITGIVFDEIPMAQMRYSTAGDYFVTQDGKLHMVVPTELPPANRYPVLAHIWLEAILCLQKGIRFSAIDAHEEAYNAQRQPGDMSEPADHPDSPCHGPHLLGMEVERRMVAEMGLSWDEHDALVCELSERIGA